MPPRSRPDEPPREGLVKRASELHKDGIAAAVADRYRLAVHLLRRGLGLLDEAMGQPGEDTTSWFAVRARLMSTLAFCMMETDGQGNAIDMMDAARKQLSGLTDPVLRDELQDQIDQNRAVLLCRIGRVAEGIALLTSTIDRAERVLASQQGDRHNHADRLVIQLANRGNAYADLADFALARRDLERASGLATEYSLPLRTGIVAHSLGNVEESIGDVPAALRRYNAASRIFKELEPGLLTRLRIDQAQALLSVGLADEAGRLLDWVLPELRREGSVQDHVEAELFRASAALMTGDLTTARRTASAANRRLLRQGNERSATLAALLVARVDVIRALDTSRIPQTLPTRVEELSDLLWSSGMPDEAAWAKLQAVRLELKRGDVQRAALLLGTVSRPHRFSSVDQRLLRRLCRAELAVAQGSHRAALAEARAGFKELDRMDDRLGGLELVSRTAVHGSELGELAIRLVLRSTMSTDPQRLFLWVERTRAHLHRYQPVPPSVAPELRQQITEVRQLGRALLRARLEGVPTTELESRHAAGRREVARLERHSNREWTVRPVASSSEVAEQLGGRVLVSFVQSDNDLAAIVIAASRTELVKLGSASTIMEQVRLLHADLNALAPDDLPEPLAAVIAASARHRVEVLDQVLLRPLAELTGDQELVVVPTDALYAVPWGSLPTCLSRAVVVVPSATSWLDAVRRVPDGRGVLLVRGPGVPADLDQLNSVIHHQDVKLLNASDARVSTVLEAMDGSALVHIAAHGAHEPENSLFSRLELVDGPLYAHEIRQLRRPPSQVVLAACELADGTFHPKDEPLGFAGALLGGGTRTVVAAVSRVGDQTTAAVMTDFHRALSAGASPATALASAIAVDPLHRPFVCLGVG